MPRDGVPVSTEVFLPGGRRGRITESIVAGQIRIIVTGTVARLVEDGTLSRAQGEAAQHLAALYEASGLRQRLCGAYKAPVDAGGDGHLLERLTTAELTAWRRFHRLLARLPAGCRAVVRALVADDGVPALPSEAQALRAGLDMIATELGLARR